MNSKITLARLAQLVATKSGLDLSECEDVLRQLFKHISACLEGGESIRVKGFGTFKISPVEARKSVDVTSGLDNEIPAHNRIVFVPSKDLAAAVNAPFDMFETIVVEEGILEEELIQAESEPNNLMSATLQQELILEEEKEDSLKKEYPAAFAELESGESPNPVDAGQSSEDIHVDNSTGEDDSVKEESSEKENHEEADDSKLVAPSETVTHDNVEDSSHASHETYNIERPHRRVWPWYIAVGLVGIIAGCGILWWLNDDFSDWGRNVTSRIFGKNVNPNDSVEKLEVATLLDNEDNLAEESSDQTGLVEEEMIPDKDSAIDGAYDDKSADEVVPTQASDKKKSKPITDTVSQTRYLTTIAKAHYGNFHLWPYIYKENEKILGHPNRIKPGTEVVVPDLSKYGVDPKNPEDIEKAKKLGVEIYKRYK
ncbi:MAG: HU family DNA-binding protein [Muribaculaceae bacterium]|nr:HU family DNA-binding protein [Muribaculaceae bacterium]